MQWLTDLWTNIDLTNAFQVMIEGAGGQVAMILPIGIGLFFVLAIPRIVRRVLATFL